jgi:hypothetical protein
MMRLIRATLVAVSLVGVTLAAQQVKTVTKEKTTFEVKDGKDVTVSGCVDRFDDGGYLLTNESGELKYVLVTNDNLSKYVGNRVEIKGLSTDDGTGRLRIEKEVGTSGVVGSEKVGDRKVTRATELSGNVGFPYVSVKSLKKLSSRCS